MKHIYTLFFSLAVLLLPTTTVAQETFTFMLIVDNPEAVEARINKDYYGTDYTELTLVAGENTVKAEEYTYLNIKCKDGYIFAQFLVDGDADTYRVSNNAINAFLSTSLAGSVMEIKTYPENEFRTSNFRLYIDNPSRVTVTYNGTFYRPQISSGWNTLNFNEEIETGLSISSNDYYNPIYKVTHNGVDVLSAYTSYNVSDLKDGDEVEIFTEYPDVDYPVHFVFTNPDTEDYIQYITINATTIPSDTYLSENFTVHAGQQMSIALNIDKYIKNSISINGVNKSDIYEYFTYRVTGETTFVFDVRPYEEFLKTINVSGAEHITFYKGYVSVDNIYPLNEGSNEVSFDEHDTTVNIIVESGYRLVELKDGEIDCLPGYSNASTYINCQKEGVLSIVVEEIALDKEFIIYVDNSDAAQYVMLENKNYDRIYVSSGYTSVKFCDDYTPYDIMWWGANFNNLYLNDVKQSNATSHRLDIEDGDVVKIFLESTPEPVTLTFENTATVKVSATRDYLTPIESLNGSVNILPGTLVQVIADDETKNISVKVDDADAVVENSYEFTVNKATTVVISDDEESAINNISVTNMAENTVYNLFGVRLDKPYNELPAGIYIVNGAKVVKK